MIYIPGEHVKISGVYEVLHLGHRPPHEAFLRLPEIFPHCRQCQGGVIFRFMHPTREPICEHISADEDFCGWVSEA